MDELTRYIVTYYPNLMTVKEKAAYKASFAEEKAENLEPGKLQTMLRERWVSSDPEADGFRFEKPLHLFEVSR